MPDFGNKGLGRRVRSSPEVMVNLPGGTAGPWYGRTVVTSAMTQVVSTTVVGSNSNIILSLQAMQVNSEALPAFVVKSISPGVAFWIGTVQSYALVGSYTAMWEVKNPK